MSSEQTLPERPAEVPAEGTAAAEGEVKLSKGALKKLEKEKAKVKISIIQYPLITTNPPNRPKRRKPSKKRKPPQKPPPMPTMYQKGITARLPLSAQQNGNLSPSH